MASSANTEFFGNVGNVGNVRMLLVRIKYPHCDMHELRSSGKDVVLTGVADDVTREDSMWELLRARYMSHL